MITTFLINIFAYIMGAVAWMLPSFTVWPQALIDGLQYIAASFAKLNFILPIQESSLALNFFINFSSAWLTAKLVVKSLNYFRGTGSGLDLK